MEREKKRGGAEIEKDVHTARERGMKYGDTGKRGMKTERKRVGKRNVIKVQREGRGDGGGGRKERNFKNRRENETKKKRTREAKLVN